MLTLFLTIALCSEINSEVEYRKAYQTASDTGQPMLIMVTAKWCAACQSMKVSVLPELKKKKVFRRVIFTVVDFDKDRELVEKLTNGNILPQLLLFQRTPNGWRNYSLVGNQAVESVELFLKQSTVEPADQKPWLSDEAVEKLLKVKNGNQLLPSR